VWLTPQAKAVLRESAASIADIRIVTREGQTSRKAALMAMNLPVREMSQITLNFIVADDTVLIYHPEEETTTISRNPGLARVLCNHLDQAWQMKEGGTNHGEAIASAAAHARK
jgi:hypothetical protein